MDKKTIAFATPILLLLALVVYLFTFNLGSTNTYQVNGRVAGFGADNKTIFIEHEDIPGYMQAMTMQMNVRDTTDLSRFSIGDAIHFQLTIEGNRSYADNIREIANSEVAEHPAGEQPQMLEHAVGNNMLQTGDQVPDIPLQNQDGESFSLQDYQGQGLIFTFIYTRCPLPDYCPLMSGNFKKLQPMLIETFGTQVQLLSISFDTEYDKPAVLKQYGNNYGADFRVWNFATATKANMEELTGQFGVFTRTEGDQIIHNLVTVFVDPNGRIVNIWRGNDWTPNDVLREVKSVL